MLQHEIVTEQIAHPIPALERKRQVLVIDDDKAVREALSRRLVSLGHNTTLVSNGFDGGVLFCTRDYDLVIIDLQVPQMNVWELSRIFKEHAPKTPVIMAAWFGEDQYWADLGTSRVDALIRKPFTLSEIEKTVERVLNNGA